MFNTARRYVQRIVVPTIFGGAFALIAFLLIQDSERNEVEATQDYTDSAYLNERTATEIESLQAAIASLDQSLTSEEIATPKLEAISQQRGEVERAIFSLEEAKPENWNTRLEYAYEQVNQYSEMIGDSITAEGTASNS